MCTLSVAIIMGEEFLSKYVATLFDSETIGNHGLYELGLNVPHRHSIFGF